MGTAILIVLICIILSIFLVRNSPRYKHLMSVLSLFKPENIAYNFVNMSKLFPGNEINSSANPTSFEKDNTFNLPSTFTYKEKIYTTEEYLDSSQTSGLIILKGNTILYEKYFNHFTEHGIHISWSVCKSIISAMMGVAFREKMIDSIHDPVEKYVPYLKDSGYAGTSIKDVLQMSSGIDFNEDYHDFRSDINRLGRVIALGRSFDKYVKSLKKVREPGVFHDYISMDTQVLGMIIKNASGMTLSSFLEKYIWQPMGAESKAFWIKDRHGMEAAFGGFNCSLRDFARFGKMYVDNGKANGIQIIPEDWVKDSVNSSEAHLQAGNLPHLSSHPYGYGYQWWLPESKTGEYMAMGVYNQFIYIDPVHKIVIVKNSSNYNYAIEKRETTFRHLSFFRAIKQTILDHE